MMRAASGVTLIELLSIVVIAAVVAAVALPSLAGLLADHRRTATANVVVTAMNQARHAAITRGATVSVCPTADGLYCGNDWQQGWMSFVEPAAWRTQDPVPTDNRLALFEPPGAIVASNRARFRFRPDRRRATNGTLVVCVPSRGESVTSVVIAPTGRVRTDRNQPDWALAVCP